jgi:hypothetical protein
MFIATCGSDDLEAALVEWQIKRANGFKRQPSALSGASGQMPPGFHEWLAEVSQKRAGPSTPEPTPGTDMPVVIPVGSSTVAARTRV